jgi:hypothetical protein
MYAELITKRLIKIASSLDTKFLHKKAELIRRICADIAKFLPEYETEVNQQNRLEKEIEDIPGVANVRGRMKPIQDAIYYDIVFKNGLKASLNQTLFGPVKTVSKITEKKPFVLRMADPTGKTLPGGKLFNKKELLDMIKKIGEGSQKEIEMLSKEIKFS